jgi:hypothetical protein
VLLEGVTATANRTNDVFVTLDLCAQSSHVNIDGSLGNFVGVGRGCGDGHELRTRDNLTLVFD